MTTYANAIDAARLLIDAGADVNAKDSRMTVPIYMLEPRES